MDLKTVMGENDILRRSGGNPAALTPAALEEIIRDAIGQIMTNSASVQFTYDDAANSGAGTLTATVASIDFSSVTTGLGTLDERIRDVIGATLVASGASVTVTPNDAGDTITIAVSSPASFPVQNQQPSDRRGALEQRMMTGVLANSSTEAFTEYWIGDSFGALGSTAPGTNDMLSLYEAIVHRHYNKDVRASGFVPYFQQAASTGVFDLAFFGFSAQGISPQVAAPVNRGVQGKSYQLTAAKGAFGHAGTGSGVTVFYTAYQTGGAVVNVTINGVLQGTQINSTDATLAAGTFSSGRRSVTYDRVGEIGPLTISMTVVSGTFEVDGAYFYSNNESQGHMLIRGDKSGQKLSDVMLSNGLDLPTVIPNLEPEIVTICLGVNDAAGGATASQLALRMVTVFALIRSSYPTGNDGGWDNDPTRVPMLPTIRYVFQNGSPFVPATWATEYRAAAIQACVEQDVLFIDGHDTCGPTTAYVATSVASGSNNVDVNTFVGTQSLSVQALDNLAAGPSYVAVVVSDAVPVQTAMIAYTSKSAATGVGQLLNCTILQPLTGGTYTLSTGDDVERSGDPVDFTTDAVHPNNRGARMYAQLVANNTTRSGTRQIPLMINTSALQPVTTNLYGFLNLKSGSGNGVNFNLVEQKTPAVPTVDASFLSTVMFSGTINTDGDTAATIWLSGVAEDTWTGTSAPSGLRIFTTATGTVTPVVHTGVREFGTLFTGRVVPNVGDLLSSATASTLEIYETSSSVVPSLGTHRSLGTIASPATVTSGTVIGRLTFKGWNSASQVSGARIDAVANATLLGPWTTSDSGGLLNFYTTEPGTNTSALRVTMNSGTAEFYQTLVIANGGAAYATARNTGVGLDIASGYTQTRFTTVALATTAGLNSALPWMPASPTLPTAPFSTSNVRITNATGPFSIGGIVVPWSPFGGLYYSDGAALTIVASGTTIALSNAGSRFAVINEDASATGRDRIMTETGDALYWCQKAEFVYDGALARWRLVSAHRPSKTNALGTLSGSVTVDPAVGDYVTATVSANATFSMAILPAGHEITFQIANSSSGSARTLTFNSPFKLASLATIITTTVAATTTVVTFRSNGTNWLETSRVISL